MIWFFAVYLVVGYYHFHQVLAGLQDYDTADTAILNSVMAFIIGPCLLVPAMIWGYLDRLDRFFYDQFRGPNE